MQEYSNIKSEAPGSGKPRRILFIVNPNAGKRRPGWIIDLIKTHMPLSVAYEIATWENKFHFDDIRKKLQSGIFTDAVAVGGDGTVNHVAKTLLNTGIALGIVPIGSGNGLARTLGLSMIIPEVLKQIVAGRKVVIDSGEVNGVPFFCTSGVGFDARIGDLFATSIKRGLKSYIKIILLELFKYKAKNYKLELNGQKIEKKAFLITVANAGQYGNDFYIAPLASMQDGLFHVVILKPFGIFTALLLLRRIMKRQAHLSNYIETYTTPKLTVRRDEEDAIHYDGEPLKMGQELVYELKRNSLTVIVGDKFIAA